MKIDTQEIVKLQEQPDLIKSVFDCIGEGVIVVDLEGNIVLKNPAAESIFGMPLEQNANNNWSEIYGLFLSDRATPFPQNKRPLIQALKGKETNEVEMFICNSNVPQGKFISISGDPLLCQKGIQKGAVILFRDITLLKKTEEELKNEAVRDSLTGLYNRKYLDEQLTQTVAKAKRYKQPLSLCLCDLDHFKSVNDTHGHPIGDKVIVKFSKILRKELRIEDIACRLGGDEFCILFPQTSAKDAGECMERIRRKFEKIKFKTESDNKFSISSSIGIAHFDFSMDSKSLMENADKALYRSKELGRNKVVIKIENTYREIDEIS